MTGDRKRHLRQFHDMTEEAACKCLQVSKDSGCRQCPICPKRVKNIYQHCRDVHKTSLSNLQHPQPQENNAGVTMSLLSEEALSAFKAWLCTVDGTKLSQKTSSMYGTCIRKISMGACKAASTFKRWHASLRKDRQEQKINVIAKSQSSVPRVAEAMKNYETSQFRMLIVREYMYNIFSTRNTDVTASDASDTASDVLDESVCRFNLVLALTSLYIDSVVPPTPPRCSNASAKNPNCLPPRTCANVATWKKSDIPLLLEKFGDHVRNPEKLSVKIIRVSDVYQYLIKEGSFTEKQVMNKLQWLKKSSSDLL
ncbi:hypothetical protein CAPTEDRAFT_193405 [Capitella teleta]|uniref:Uncharacterized protein n=1 Tax=Capitella teleta TaxID=283909 RepID=R7TUS4_CAPTE|nr:hypothetical protein CAPTEDRAFT_193405 [Capitella teleta]|eukprot:ELT97449.1 hypothetical protein CAPTEDRAFT_193405 [Capitella teleta]